MYSFEKEHDVIYIKYNGKREYKFEKYTGSKKGYIRFVWHDFTQSWINPNYFGWFKSIKAIKAYYKIV